LSTLTINLIITAIAFISIVVLVVYTVFFGSADAAAQLATLSNGLSHGFLGIIAALQFGMWFYLGIEGTAMSAEECRSTHRALPLGSLIAMISLLVGATLTWFVCSSLIPPDVLGSSVYPLFDAAKQTGVPVLIALLLIGTVFSCLASSNGCIIDSSRALFSMSRDTLMPEFFSALHPKHKTPYRATLFLVPIAAVFAFTGMLDHVITFSIISALYVYLYSAIMILRFRKMYPLGTIKRGYTVPAYKLLAAVIIAIVAATMFGMYLGYWIDILAATLFYAICSVWFLKFRSGSIDTHKFFSAENHDWPKPKKF
ncbi:MAG: amino acid permease, partial [Oscillospiraceae bacterium]|nr:amino acid permease [Oscillospiraceae bacterium]